MESTTSMTTHKPSYERGFDLGGFFLGVGIGALCAFLLEPSRGARRRALIYDKTSRWMRLGVNRVDRAGRNLKNRLYGSVIESKNRLVRRGEEVDDDILIERIRSKTGRVLSHPKMLQIDSSQGRVTLSGHAMQKEIPSLIHRVRSTVGVRHVINNVQPVANEKQMSSSASTARFQSGGYRGSDADQSMSQTRH